MAIVITEALPLMNLTNFYDPAIVSSSLAVSSTFRYVADVSGAIASARLKCDPIPSTRLGFFGVNKIIETLFVPAIPQVTKNWQTGNWAVKANVTFREELGGAITGTPVSASIFAIEGNSDYFDYISIFIARNSDLIATSVAGSASYLFSNRPTFRRLLYNTPEYVHAVLDNTIITAINIRIRYLNESRTILRTFWITRNTTTISQIINVGGSALYTLTAGECSDGNAGSVSFPAQNGYIDYQFHFDNTTTSTGKTRSRLYEYQLKTTNGTTFTPNTSCFTSIYEVTSGHEMTLLFKNHYGAWDTFEFTMKKRKRLSVKREQSNINSDVYGFQRWNLEQNVEYQYEYELNTDWLTDTEFDWLAELIVSPRVYLHISGISWLPVLIKNNSYDFFTRRNDGLRQLQITIAVGDSGKSI
jgi:hypothetical protein